MNTHTTLGYLARLLREKGIACDLVCEGGSPGPENTCNDASELPICGVDCDSRVVASGHLFVCKGAAFRADYLRSALEKGAVAYLCDASHASELASACPDAPALVVPDDELRPAMAHVSAVGWGHPDHDIRVVGITGTKGKSTTAYLLRAIIDAGPDGAGKTGSTASVIGSIDTYDGIECEESHNTTPEPPDLWRHLANARTSGHEPMVMEVSSHALKYDRVRDLSLTQACFLNIGRDHISPAEHPNEEDYFASKLRIFELSDTAVVNLASDRVDEVLAAASHCKRVLAFGVAEGGADASVAAAPPQAGGHIADVWASDVRSSEGTVDFVVHTPDWTHPMHLGMPGLFNVDNALCAIVCAWQLGIGPEQIRAGIARCRVPGRMELVDSPDPHVAVIVDYAHNKLSYQRFFSSIKQEFAGRRIIAVFGAPGNKAQERRRELPQEAARWADVLIYTEEDPAHERVEDINAEMMAATPEGTWAESVPDRGEAIARAVQIAYESTTPALLCLLAKGDETRQHEGDLFVPCETDEALFHKAMAARRIASR
jgi:UDP-N-acetylmuramoyl-L-alanyl-D-glutamate--2,6-diaminopimelate ligase